MNKEEFAGLMAARGCTPHGKDYCGTFQNYPFAVTFFGSRMGVTSFNVRFPLTDNPKSIFKTVRAELKGEATVYAGTSLPGTYITADAAIAKPAVAVTVSVKRKHPVDAVFDKVVSLITSTANSMGLTPPTTCAVCEREGTNAFGLHYGMYTPVHTGCVQGQVATTYNKVAQNQTNGNYTLGILGAILGAIVGAAPNVLVMVVGERIMVYLCLLIPLGAFFGYKLFRGKLNNVATAIIVVISVLIIPVMDYFAEAFYSQQEYGEWLPVSLYTTILFDSPEKFVGAYLQLLLFVGIGVFAVWGIISNANKRKLAGASAQASSVRAAAGSAPQTHFAPPPPSAHAEPPKGPDLD